MVIVMPLPDIRSIPVKNAAIDDISIAYRDFGSGKPLVLINGFASTMDMWNPPVLSALAEQFRIIIFDTRGTGYSSSSGKPFSIPLFAGDTLSLMDALDIPRAHVLGLSMCASVALELALGWPDRVERLVLVSGQCGGQEAVRMRPEVWATLSDKSGTASDVADRMFSLLFPRQWRATHDPFRYCPEVYETTSGESAARQADAFLSWTGCCSRLHAIRVPVLIVTGTEDVVIPPENSSHLAKNIPGAEVIPFCGAGHGLMYQVPREFAGALLSFLGSGR
jgi:pimeloyl-ACP methyl ester carboxylesterase